MQLEPSGPWSIDGLQHRIIARSKLLPPSLGLRWHLSTVGGRRTLICLLRAPAFMARAGKIFRNIIRIGKPGKANARRW